MTGISGMSAETSITAILVSQRNLFLIVFIISKLLELYINKRFPEAETTAAPKQAANGKSFTQRVSEGYAALKGKAANFIAQHKPAATTNPQAQPPIWTKPQAKAQPQKNELDHYTAESSAFARSAPNTSKETDTAANLTRLIKLNSANFALHITNAFAIPGRGVEVVGYLLGNVAWGQACTRTDTAAMRAFASGSKTIRIIGIERNHKMLNSLEAFSLGGCGILLSNESSPAPEAMIGRVLIG